MESAAGASAAAGESRHARIGEWIADVKLPLHPKVAKLTPVLHEFPHAAEIGCTLLASKKFDAGVTVPPAAGEAEIVN